MTIDAIMRTAPVIPVLVLDGSVNPAELAATLVKAGLRVIEVTLRTPLALDAIRAMSEIPGAIVGAGTVLDAGQFKQAVEAGSRFIVSPGLTPSLADAARVADVPFLPGVATAGDIMRGLDLGLDHFKFFPAESSGGIPALQALSGPFGGVRFCPTGGITADSAPHWLALDSVLCVGGSWLLKTGESDLALVAQRARQAATLGSGR
ncbi:bifunctional 4-hydroxy-2-oxoglutarate aldolase/2-dehydro-3-deoxy-phosphogluconate aldolase [Sphingomonas sp.]|uniref:bifunctional 4-hydroxy-2-oxoglutarate aldolase/2-dehydro-3-deoxy-phosphogluconate aldolase n=1 Tax=Sphingomonas sp. TaxID=28214 RepID=UPI00286D073B|nr:bifunctional 4-hydroxy-2-oxoglutarate aldolase/2-dehydro-3-deoxy-phosphogluconate aldolase [Sphingomonas sp.]